MSDKLIQASDHFCLLGEVPDRQRKIHGRITIASIRSSRNKYLLTDNNSPMGYRAQNRRDISGTMRTEQQQQQTEILLKQQQK